MLKAVESALCFVYCLQVVVGEKYCVSLVLKSIDGESNAYEWIGLVSTKLVEGRSLWYDGLSEEKTVIVIK